MQIMPENDDVQRQRVGVVVTHLSHYRRGVYEVLQESPNYEFSFFGDVGDYQGIIGVDESAFASITRVRFRRIGSFVWQHRVLRLGINEELDALIILGDARVVSTWILAALARMRGKRVLFWTQGWANPDKFPRRFVRKRFYSLANMLLLYGETGRNLAIRYGFAPDQLQVIGNSIFRSADLERSKPTRRELVPGSLVVGIAARLTNAKRLDLLLTALHGLAQKGVNVRLRLVGEGPARESLMALSEELSIAVDILGAQYDEASLKRFYESIDLTVIPQEAGLTITQSMGAGVPVVICDDPYSNGPEIDAVRDGVTGFVFRKDDSESLLMALERYMTFTSSQRADMSRAAYLEIVEYWTAEHQAAKITDALERTL